MHICIPQPPSHSARRNSCLFASVHISKCVSAPRKNTTSASCSRWWQPWLQLEYLHSVKSILGTNIGVGCSKQSQLYITRARSALIAPLCKLHAFGCCIPPILVLCPRWSWQCATCAGGAFLYIKQGKYSTCNHGGHHLLQLALVVFFLGALAHLLMCTQTNRHILRLVLCGGGGCVFMWR